MDENLVLIKEANKEIKEALADWQGILCTADADQWAYYLEYDEKDLFNALYIFNHVAQNIAIKNGFYKDEEDAQQKMSYCKEGIKKAFGFDTVELTEQVLNNVNK